MQFTGQAKTQDPSLQHDWVITCGMNTRAVLGGRHRGQMLTLRLTAVARRLAVDLADPPHQLGGRVYQTRIVAEHPDVPEHVAQHLTRLRRTEEHVFANLARDVELFPERPGRNHN